MLPSKISSLRTEELTDITSYRSGSGLALRRDCFFCPEDDKSHYEDEYDEEGNNGSKVTRRHDGSSRAVWRVIESRTVISLYHVNYIFTKILFYDRIYLMMAGCGCDMQGGARRKRRSSANPKRSTRRKSSKTKGGAKSTRSHSKGGRK